KPSGAMIFWKAQAPCFSGLLAFPSAVGREVAGHTRCTQLKLGFDGRALHGDARWREAVVALVPAIARPLGAGYAAAYVRRGVIARRGSTWTSLDDTETVLMPGASFTGLPPGPTWLAWFGPAYAPHVASAFAGRTEVAADGTLFFRGGDEP